MAPTRLDQSYLHTLRNGLCFLLLTLIASSSLPMEAGTITIGRTPILTATLPTNSTYQAEFSTNGINWVGTSVLVAGKGSSTTVRLDGFPNAIYRLTGVDSANIVSPIQSTGMNVGASFPGASEVRIESVNQLGGTWTNYAFAFSNFQNNFVVPVRSPLGNKAFFRAVQPATPLVLATVSSYLVDTNNTAAGYGIVADDMPQLYRDGFITALCPNAYNRGGISAAAAGECYELTGPLGKTTVIVADYSPDSPAGTCDIGRPYFDIGTRAFTNLCTIETGYGTVTYRLVPAPVIGNVKMVCVNYSGGYYVELRPYNHRAGVIKLEAQSSGGPWTELSHTDYNSFVYTSGTPLVPPINVRVTSRFGEQVTFPVINSIATSNRFTANAQFTTFPDQGPSPVWVLPPVYADALTNVLGATWGAVPYSGATVDSSYSGNVYQGNYSLRISGMGGFGGVTFISPTRFWQQPDAYLEFAIRSEGNNINGLKIRIEGVDAVGTFGQSIDISLPPVTTNWRTFRIPLDPAATPVQITQFRIMNSTSGTLPNFDLDAIAFRW